MARSFRSDTSSNVVKLSSRVGVGRPAPPKEHGRCLAGLTFEETIEFEALEELPPF